MLPLGDTSQLHKQMQTQSEMVQNDPPSKWHPEKEGIAILTSEKIDFKIKKVIRDKN